MIFPALLAALLAQAAPASAGPGRAIANAPPAAAPSGRRDALVLEVQILLDHARQSPGVIDGRMGANTRRAIRAYQRQAGFPQTGEIDDRLLQSLHSNEAGPLLRNYRVTEQDAAGPFRNVPSSMTGKSGLDRVAFESPAEMLAERFHMSKALLEASNPGVDLGKPGTLITVVNPGDDEHLSRVSRIEVDKQAHALRAYGSDGALVASYPTTVGSSVHPSPHETLQVVAIAPHPTYHFDPSGRDWGPDHALTIAPGPNNPVGVVWIALSRDGFGIHGTPEPRLIGKTSSHGCVRLTNWDAHELSLAVAKGTAVEFL